MSKPIFCAVLILASIIFLFFPIQIQMDVHYDMNRKKLAFSIYLYKRLRLIGGYIGVYQGGIALHVSQKKAFLFPYKQLNTERKRFSVLRSFKMLSCQITTETGTEYLLPILSIKEFAKVYFVDIKGNSAFFKHNVWLIDGDALRISISVALRFNFYFIVKKLLIILKEKAQSSWNKRKAKSTD